MAKNRFSMQPKQQTPAMSSAHPHTVGAAASILGQDDEEDNDICPVCDGECTCDNKPRVLPQPTSLNHRSMQFIGSSSSNFSALPHPSPNPTPLKIKLTVPPSFLGNQKNAPSWNKPDSSTEMTSAVADDGESSYSASRSSIQSPSPPAKRRGRPPKSLVTSSGAATPKQSAPSPVSYYAQHLTPQNVGSTKHKKSGPLPNQSLKAGYSGQKRSQNHKRRIFSDWDGESSLSNLTDEDDDRDDGDDDDDRESAQFPTFVSASVLSSMDSGDSSDSSDSPDSSDSEIQSFNSDSDIEKEEEHFIVSEVHEKARLRRELLGDDNRRPYDPRNDWVIRPRKRSVETSDAEMDVDSNGTDEEEEEEEQDLDEDDEETDEKSVGGGHPGLVTVWSEDDESSFDADLFFTNLTDSDSNSDSSCSPNDDDDDGGDGDQSDMDAASCSDTAELMNQRQELENLQLEVTESWDGQIVFTNGFNDGRGVLDIDFEMDASQFMVESSSSRDSDVDMSSSSIGTDEGGYEEGVDGDGGDTTDEELVGEDNLPNERAMKMFSLPFGVSAIDPLSTVSPVVSPSHRRHPPFGRNGSLGSPRPEDILAGKFSWDSDDRDRDGFEEGRVRSRSHSRGSGPRTGLFVPVQETRQAIIDGSKEVPSPHPRFNRRRGRMETHRINAVEQALRRCLLNNSRSAPTFTTASELLSPLQLLSSDNDFGSSSPSLSLTALAEGMEPLGEAIDLNDVLEASFLVPESSENTDNGSNHSKRAVEHVDENDELASGKLVQNLSRWDVISVGAFRQTRESVGWSSDCTHQHTPHSSVDYGSIMKTSPLSSIMWPKEKKEKERKRRKRREPIAISPMILPVRDGDRTPTSPGSQQQNNPNKHSHKAHKETKRERKLKKKNWGPVHHQHSHHQQRHHTHQHHPNTKTRGSAAAQRPFSTAVPPFNL